MIRKFLEKIFSKRKIGTAILILVGVIFTIVLFYISENIESSLSWTERLYFSAQIVATLYVVFGAVIAVWQYYISTKSEKIKNESDKVKQAIDLAGYYKDNIIPMYSSIRYIYDKIGALKIIKTIKTMKEFDEVELKQNLTVEQISVLKNSIQTKTFIEAVREANFLYNLNLMDKVNLSESENSSNTNSDELLGKMMQLYIEDRMKKLLNNMEYFSMYFTHNTADDTVVYQSLHQSFFEIVETMYYYISRHNSEPNHKFFVNVISLYLKWKNRDKENLDKIDSAKQNYNKKIQNSQMGTISKNLDTK